MGICTLLGLLGGLFLIGWVALAVFFWRREREASRRHKEQLRLLGTEELLARARNWGPMNRHEDLPAVVEFRSLLEQHRYEEMLQGWRALTASLFALEEHVSSAGPQFYDSDSFRVLRDYVEVLHERQQRGE
ncbi:hypothetical protein ATI61_106649 [Archangium gephyra]|uniref:Uncharacterized protein n=1 Tax=Archangium gephyra TaxID=48 RepID=A0AAC8Q1H3_9BACT|nr:hypothetical protein [Archangium gephyra]AKI99274.1 Hypothetical protein AA314_00901 [Archangium gephyra]REG31179.1 hypothetical protein ATI61_106649 [Archangium gephyra]